MAAGAAELVARLEKKAWQLNEGYLNIVRAARFRRDDSTAADHVAPTQLGLRSQCSSLTTEVSATNMVHAVESLLSDVSELKLSVILGAPPRPRPAP